MEKNENQSVPNKPDLSQEQMIKEIYADVQKTKKLAKWQMYITLVLVVLPLLALLAVLPIILKTLEAGNAPSVQVVQ